MESRLTVLVCVAVSLFICQAHGKPASGEDESRAVRLSPSDFVDEIVGAAKPELPPIQRIPEEDEPAEEDKPPIELIPAASELTARFPDDQRLIEGDDIIRAKKSATMREMQFDPSGHHTTTVCIQVRSNQNPHVVCGPQVNEEKKEEKPPAPPGPKARFAYQQAPVEYIITPQQPMFRAAEMQAPYLLQVPQEAPKKPAPAVRPAPIAYQIRRTDAEIQTSNIEEPKPAPSPPIAAQPVIVHKQVFQAPMPTTAMVAPMRLNCAMSPGGAVQYVQPMYSGYGSPAMGGYSTYGEQFVTVPEGPAARMAMDGQTLYFDGQSNQIISSPFPGSFQDSFVGTPFVGDDGQTYLIDSSQSRMAVDNLVANQQQWEQQQYLDAMGASPARSSAQTSDQNQPPSMEQVRTLEASLLRIAQALDSKDTTKVKDTPKDTITVDKTTSEHTGKEISNAEPTKTNKQQTGM